MMRLWLQLHKWIALAVSAPVLGWVLGGLIMTALPLSVVTGQHRAARPIVSSLDLTHTLSLTEQVARAGFGPLSSAELRSTPRGPIWVLSSAMGGESWWDARTGENVQELDEKTARPIAISAYKGSSRLKSLAYQETASEEAQVGGPVWRASFGDPERTRLYLDAFTGEVLSRRSDIWRVYDFFYQIHILNFGASRSYNHPGIVIAAFAALTMVATGIVLLWLRLSQDFQVLRKNRKR